MDFATERDIISSNVVWRKIDGLHDIHNRADLRYHIRLRSQVYLPGGQWILWTQRDIIYLQDRCPHSK
jgi:hypothetical protein